MKGSAKQKQLCRESCGDTAQGSRNSHSPTRSTNPATALERPTGGPSLSLGEGAQTWPQLWDQLKA
jgi:hypothetical protein